MLTFVFLYCVSILLLCLKELRVSCQRSQSFFICFYFNKIMYATLVHQCDTQNHTQGSKEQSIWSYM